MSPRSSEAPRVDWPQRLAATTSASKPCARLASVFDQVSRLLGASIGGVLWTEPGAPQGVHLGLRRSHLREYLDVWQAKDPVLQAALALQVAVRDVDVCAEGVWRNVPLVASLGRRIGAHSYIVVPIYGAHGEVSGTIHLCRASGQAPFSAHDLRHATAFAGFASATLSRLGLASHAEPTGLAPREYQVALLAARGFSNRTIGEQVGIAGETVRQTLRRVYRKMGVGNRTELAARYARAGMT
jgi:DNA-binding CsgD family transcriptional regulator